MSSLLNQHSSEREIQMFERKYNDAIDHGNLNRQIEFEYACCLVRSKASIDIERGIEILVKLCRLYVNARKDFMLYLAIGYTHLKNYSKATELLDCILLSDRSNMQALELKAEVEKLSSDELKSTIYDVSAGALILGGIAGLAMTLLKR